MADSPTAAPLILGVNRTQDASVCLLRGSRVVWSVQKERLTRQKHHWGALGDFRDVYAPRLPGLDRPIDVLVESFSSDREMEKLADYEQELAATLSFAPDCRRVRISHHLSHLYSVFHPSPFDEAAVMIVDGQGSPAGQFTEAWPGAGCTPSHWREVSSFYRASRTRIECVAKQLWDCDDARPAGLGMFYFLLTQAMFPGEGNEGKVMGLAPHGDPNALRLPGLDVDGMHVALPAAWTEILRDKRRFRYAAHDGVRFADIANLAAAGQRAFENALLQLARTLHAMTGARALCFAGGTALNCSANDRLLRETPFRSVFIPPAPSDAGTSLGCAMYGLAEVLQLPCEYRWTHDYLGPAPATEAIDEALRGAGDLDVETPGSLPAAIADLLAAGKVVGLFGGPSEFGPRALGHRSILGDPRTGRMRDWINAKVKLREWFRPLAPIVLLEDADRYFDIRRPSPFMQFAAPVRREMAAVIPAVTHVDCTARLQTVGPDDDPLLRAVLEQFARRTGVPVLLNTSFNGKDEPIVESPAEALATFRATPMHALAMPPYVVRKRGAPGPVA
ncbi:MAG TPA: carbamoyltransferase C-terminal domain-containing protein [Casimicrobiaceae bacterium]|nr:carbamoyltransferase C-terminal domain-containing protein [Casimicrobiaceae bacterium]